MLSETIVFLSLLVPRKIRYTVCVRGWPFGYAACGRVWFGVVRFGVVRQSSTVPQVSGTLNLL